MLQSVIEIDLGAIRTNYLRIVEEFPNMEMAPVIKSDAYGHGAVQVAKVLTGAGAKYLSVFTVEEAAELRRGGIGARLIVLEGALEEDFELAAALGDAVFAVWNRDNIRALSEYALAHNRLFQVHLKLDTGMSRLGFFPEEVPEVLALIAECKGLVLKGAFTHLASADNPESGQTARQTAAFRDAVRLLPPDAAEVHIEAAPGMMADAAPEYKLARPGVVIYGYGDTKLHPNLKLELAMSFKSRIISLKTVPAGASISYGATYTISDAPQRIAVIPVGYADGYPRLLANRTAVLIRGQRAPQRGRICMGMLMVDVTNIPDAQIGDEVVLLGKQGNEVIDAGELAKIIGTIPYEFLCSLGCHHTRKYLD